MCALVSCFTTRKYDDQKNGDIHLAIQTHCQVMVLNSAAPDNVQCYNVLCGSHDGLHCAGRGLHLRQNSDLGEHVIGHVMMRGGMQIVECAVGRLSGSVAIEHPVSSVRTFQ